MRVYIVVDQHLDVLTSHLSTMAITDFLWCSNTGENPLTVNGEYMGEEWEDEYDFCEDALSKNKPVIMWDMSDIYPIAKLHVVEL
jgi:hypothetical protein